MNVIRGRHTDCNRMIRTVRESRVSLLKRYVFVIKALLGLATFDLLGLGHNFSKLHRGVGNWPVASDQHVQSAEACEAINHACVWYPKRVLCLQRSAVLTCLLRTGGIRAKMVLGAQNLPFKAHAWTEVDGQA